MRHDFLLAFNYLYLQPFLRYHDYSLHIHTPPLFQVELEKDGWEYTDMLWCQGAQIQS